MVKDQITVVSKNLENHEDEIAEVLDHFATAIDNQCTLNDQIDNEIEDLLFENKFIYRAIKNINGSEPNSQLEPLKNSLYDMTFDDGYSSNMRLDTNEKNTKDAYGISKYFDDYAETEDNYGKKSARYDSQGQKVNTSQDRSKASFNGKGIYPAIKTIEVS